MALFISGFVRDDETNQPVKSVTVTLKRGGGEVAAPTVVSGTSGEFEFTGIGSGDYRIEVDAKGYQPASVAAFLGGTPMLNVIVALRRPNPSSSLEDLSVSAHQLSVPDKPRDEFTKGVKLLTATQPDYKRAVLQFQRAISDYPTYYEAYAELAIAFYHMGLNADAEKSLRESIHLSSGRYADAQFLLAEMLDDLNRFQEAEPVARQGIKDDASSWRGYLALARALSGLKRPAEAEVSATKATELNPENPEAFLVLGNIHIQEHNWSGVVRAFDAFLQLEPTGRRSDQVRQSRAQAAKALEATPHQSPMNP